MAKAEIQKLVTIQVDSAAPARECWATGYSIEKRYDQNILFFGNGRHAEFALCVSPSAVKEQRPNFAAFLERLGPKRGEGSFKMERQNDVSLTIPADVILVSQRAGEAEFVFCSYSLHDLATVGKAAQPQPVSARRLVMVRCPVPMMQEIMFALLDANG